MESIELNFRTMCRLIALSSDIRSSLTESDSCVQTVSRAVQAQQGAYTCMQLGRNRCHERTARALCSRLIFEQAPMFVALIVFHAFRILIQRFNVRLFDITSCIHLNF